MKLYDKIWIPEKKEGVFAFRDSQGDVPVPVHATVIVLTIEELQELWNAAAWNGYENRIDQKTQGEVSVISPDFTIYLQSKGINIIP